MSVDAERAARDRDPGLLRTGVRAPALAVSAIANVGFGLASVFPVFAAVWIVNGWAQSAGVPVSGVVMAAWFSPRELGTRYSIWSMAHHLGEGLTFVFTAHLIGAA